MIFFTTTLPADELVEDETEEEIEDTDTGLGDDVLDEISESETAEDETEGFGILEETGEEDEEEEEKKDEEEEDEEDLFEDDIDDTDYDTFDDIDEM